MVKFSKKKIAKITIIILFIILLLISLIFILTKNQSIHSIALFSNSQSPEQNQINSIESQMEKRENTEELEETSEEIIPINNNIIEDDIASWRIKIPKIGLDAPILDGTDDETLKKAVGHFSESSTWEGNIGLASHNRGSKRYIF